MKRFILLALLLVVGCGKSDPPRKSFVEANAIYEDEKKQLDELGHDSYRALDEWSRTDDPDKKEELHKKYEQLNERYHTQEARVEAALQAKEAAKN